MLPSIEVRSDLRIGDLYWLFFSNSIRKLTYARWVVAIVLVFLVALGTQYIAFVALVIPKRCFASSQQLNEARSIIKANVKSKVKQRDYWP